MFKRTATLFTAFIQPLADAQTNFSLELLKKIRSAIEDATQKIDAGDWRIAQDLLKSTIENHIEKNDIHEKALIRKAYFLHGLASELRGRKYHEEALKSFQEVLKINPKDVEAKQHIESIQRAWLEFPPGIKVTWIKGSDQPLQDDELEKTPGN